MLASLRIVTVIGLMSVVGLCTPATRAAAQQQQKFPSSGQVNATSLHGTVNIILANQNGLVALTDSRLSSAGHPVASGQKLFKLDDKTICTVAGSYLHLARTPTGEVVGIALVSKVLTALPGLPYWRGLSAVEQKLAALSDALSLEFDVVLDLDRASVRTNNSIQDPQPIEITVAGYDAGGLAIAYTNLTAIREGSGFFFRPSTVKVIRVRDSLEYSLAGIRDFDEPILAHPETRQTYDIGPVGQAIKRYAAAKAKDEGASLTLDEMRQLAIALEGVSASRAANVIGDSVEIATLSGGQIVSFQASLAGSSERNVMRLLPHASALSFFLLTDVGFSHFGTAIKVGAGYMAVVVNSSIDNSAQSLDYTSFSGTRFDHVIFTYSGSPVVLFGPTNTVTDSMIRLGPRVTRDNPFVKYLLATFPGLSLMPKR